ncbi:hypothetical protein JKP88DRAFT_299987 [Tribonema minus]|uniref:Uncharacterized protein n=1 Tax=Tribonema minus TaxID=303371 RepID=A0A835Z954_9STRA|nr:hypothetical protein JKP88DRAFT_299987 [Tribonema minus]
MADLVERLINKFGQAAERGQVTRKEQDLELLRYKNKGVRNNSNLQALQAPGAPWRLHEVFFYVAKDMATVASTYIQVHFQRRRLAITYWALFQALRAHIMNDDDDPHTQVDMTARLNQLGFRGAELDDDGDVQEGADYLKILDICETVRHLPDGNSDASKRRLLAQLQQLYVETDRTDYQDLMSGLFEQFPDDAAARRENRDAVWGLLPVPPKLTAPLPRFKPQPAFIRIDRTGMGELFPGYRILAPWLVDRTFMTDGHQLKLLLVGYINEELGDVLEGEVAEGPNGVFRLQRVHREIGAEPATVADGTPAAQERLHALDHVVVTGVDPGQVLAFSAVTALGQRWRRDSAADFAANPPPEGEGVGVTAQEVSGAEYRVWAQSVRNEQGEAQRRGANQAYSDALAALADRHTRTGRYQAAIAKMAEKLAPIRLQHRPPGMKRVRSRGREYPWRRRRHRRWRDTHRRPRRIIFFGACTRFPANGRAAIPIKKLAAEGGVAVINRDTNARANLGMRGVYATCGVDDIIPGYVPADQEEEEESDEEDDDEEDGDEEDDEDEDGEEGDDGDEGGDGGGGASMTGRAVVTRRGILGWCAFGPWSPRKLEYQTDVATSALVKGNLLFAACGSMPS